jgi:hypothetical protein
MLVLQDDLDEFRRALRITPAPLAPEHLQLRVKQAATTGNTPQSARNLSPPMT